MLFILVFFALFVGFFIGVDVEYTYHVHPRPDPHPTIDPTVLNKFPEVAQGIPAEQEMKERHEWGEETRKRLFRAHNSY